ncbi:RNA methyltransferase [Pacificispira sp.]|uniref:RNA methyltransferase n=1 Tax=Pacificispira sp. TaxID=2888761 RepID=UPI002EC16DDB|nr:RNA methyltransferase [Pseudomonadota bacterium]
MTEETVPDLSPVIILVDPQLGENIGMCARAMLNCGLTKMRIVRPRDGWPNQKARDASSGALDVIDGATLHETVEDAVADLTRVYATTGRKREMVETVMTPRAAASDIRKVSSVGGERCGVLFGGERSGLNNDDVAKADVILRVPLNPDFKSLNLAQAVLLVGYEWFIAADETPDFDLDIGGSRPATRQEIDIYIDRLGRGLDEGGFFRAPEMRPTVMRNIRLLFQRANLTDQDIRTLHGIVESLRRAGPERG